MKLVKAYNSVSLVLRIVIGMVIGAALALLIPNAAVTAPGIGILGTLFVGALKAIAPLLVFVLIISALAQSKEKLGKPVRHRHRAVPCLHVPGGCHRRDRELPVPRDHHAD